MSALAMAICIRGMTLEETVFLTQQMLASGQRMSWTGGCPSVDKHSTGGLGDKVSLVLAPLLACCDLQIPMISGRGLGITGGTLDKLESIPGFRTDLTIAQIQRQTERVGCVICAATDDLAPADRKLYALRDVTGTVESIPLITASILSKKLAESLDSLVLDVKFGSGAFMRTAEQARLLAESLVRVGVRMGTKTLALLTDMNQPLGRAVGNALEVDEAVDSLQGEGPQDLWQLTLALATELLLSQQRVDSIEEAERLLKGKIADGSALEKFREMVHAQGGDLDAKRPIAPMHVVRAWRTGCLVAVDGTTLGQAIIELGGGRKTMGDPIDHSVGLEMLARVGDEISRGDPLLRVYGPPSLAAQIESLVASSVTLGDDVVPPRVLIRERITSQDIQEGDIQT
jgi:pyrimidine-nucleoside phosphorylase